MLCYHQRREQIKRSLSSAFFVVLLTHETASLTSHQVNNVDLQALQKNTFENALKKCLSSCLLAGMKSDFEVQTYSNSHGCGLRGMNTGCC